MKYIFRLIFLTSILISSLFSVSIELDGTQTLLSGTDCSTASYRFGTTASYDGYDLDIIVDVTEEDNDYNPNTCVDIKNNVISFHIRDKDYYDNMAYANATFTIVRKGTTTPVVVDMLTSTNFDLDSNGNISYSESDDVYYKSPLQTLISNNSDVLLQTVDYEDYTVKLKGKTSGDCLDTADNIDISCRGGALWKNVSSIEARVQNDNAYGTVPTDSYYNSYHRLIQFSFEYDDIAPLIAENNSTQDCGDEQFYSTTDSEWVEGNSHSEYTNKMNIQKVINIPNAQQIEITINGETEEDYDYLYIIDENGVSHSFDGEIENEVLIINGSSVTLKLETDYSETEEGVTVKVKALGCPADFGDAPNNYTHVSHKIDENLYLGNSTPDAENDQQSSTDATGDGDDDSDGVVGLVPTLTVGDSSYTVPVKVFNNTGQNAYITAWIDFNRNGTFEFSEALNTNDLSIPSSSNAQTINVVWDDFTDGDTQAIANATEGKAIMRIRLTTERILRYVEDTHKDEPENLTSPDGEIEDYEISIENLIPFTCTDKLYLSNRSELGTGNNDSGATWLHTINRESTPYAFTAIGDGFTSTNGGYNAIGYNTKDNFIYGMYGKILVKIDSDGMVQELGEVSGLWGQLYAGEFDRDGFYYVSSAGAADNQMYKIDIEKKEVIETITLSSAVRFWDMAIDASGDYFYAMLLNDGDNDSSFNNDKVAKIKIADGTITTIGDSHADLPSYIGLVFSDIDGDVFMMSNENGFYKVNTTTGELILISSTSDLTFYNDGTSCPGANISEPVSVKTMDDLNVVEGDDGIKHVSIKVHFSEKTRTNTGFDIRFIQGTAKDASNHEGEEKDYAIPSTTNLSVILQPDLLSYDIKFDIIGDKFIEDNEQFTIELYNPRNILFLDNQAVVTIINDDAPTLNIERTNSDTVDNATPERKKALYTQISGRDFDYAIVSTNEDSTFDVSDVTVKVELFDNNSSKIDDVIKTAYLYTNESNNRFKILDNNDLKIERATRNASFRLSFLLDENGTMLHGNYANEVDYNVTKARDGNKEKLSISDHFAIRPNTYNIAIKDKDENNNSVTYDTSTLLKLVAGHNYQVEANATTNNNNTIALKYTQNSISQLNSQLIFDDKITCNDDSNRSLDYRFTDGTFTKMLSHNNYGKYNLKIVDSNWTAIDQENGDCILDDSSISANGDSKSGCNIESDDVALKFMPYEFDMSATTLKNIHNNKNYLYMSDLNRSTEMGVKLSSIINAVGENNTTLSNFTKSCMSSDIRLQLGLKFSFISDEGESNNTDYTPPKSIATIGGVRTTLMPQQVVYLNDDNTTNVEHMRDINIEEAFLDENNGSMTISTLYNMEKLFRKPTNPIKVDFISLDVNSSNLNAKLRNKEHDANGIGEILENRIFYFARIASKMEAFPETSKKVIKTPLYVEIFCKVVGNRSWCDNTMNLNTIGRNGYKTDRGWYLAKEHNNLVDGKITSLVSNDNNITAQNNGLAGFIDGQMKDVTTTFTAPAIEGTNSTDILIKSDVWLRFNTKNIDGENSSSYAVTFKGIADTTGIGLNGHMQQRRSQVERNGKMSW